MTGCFETGVHVTIVLELREKVQHAAPQLVSDVVRKVGVVV